MKNYLPIETSYRPLDIIPPILLFNPEEIMDNPNNVYEKCLGKTQYEMAAQVIVGLSQLYGDWTPLGIESFVLPFQKRQNAINTIQDMIEDKLMDEYSEGVMLSPIAIDALVKGYPFNWKAMQEQVKKDLANKGRVYAESKAKV